MSITVFVPGTPKGQPRPRAYAAKLGGKSVARVFNPSTAEGWKGSVAAALQPYRNTGPIDGPVAVDLAFVMPRPKRLMRRKDPEGSIPHTAKPDADNLAKAVLDVCTDLGIWRDDSQITLLRVGKLYAGKVGTPGCRIVIEEKAS